MKTSRVAAMGLCVIMTFSALVFVLFLAAAPQDSQALIPTTTQNPDNLPGSAGKQLRMSFVDTIANELGNGNQSADQDPDSGVALLLALLASKVQKLEAEVKNNTALLNEYEVRNRK